MKKFTQEIPIIEALNLEHTYETGVQALSNINLAIYPGEFIGLIGQNGSGKSTLAKHLNGLLRPTKGKLFINGADTAKKSIVSIAQTVGFAFQNPDHQIFCATVREELAFGPRNTGLSAIETQARVEEALDRFRITRYADYPPAILGFGIRRKVSLAAIYSMKPQVMIMDEPTAGLDWKSAMELMIIASELNDAGHTIILITHDMRIIAEFTARSVVLKDGVIIMDGPTREVLVDFTMLRKTQITPPQVIQLSDKLLPAGFPGYTLSNEEFLHRYEKL
jgi:energy-coupling factor transporter ATP-binding protein EcfA2